MLKFKFLKFWNFLVKIPILKEFEWFEWFGPSPIEPFNSEEHGAGEVRAGAAPHLLDAVPVGTLREELRVAEAVPSDRTPIAQTHEIESSIT